MCFLNFRISTAFDPTSSVLAVSLEGKATAQQWEVVYFMLTEAGTKTTNNFSYSLFIVNNHIKARYKHWWQWTGLLLILRHFFPPILKTVSVVSQTCRVKPELTEAPVSALRVVPAGLTVGQDKGKSVCIHWPSTSLVTTSSYKVVPLTQTQPYTGCLHGQPLKSACSVKIMADNCNTMYT